MSERRGFFASLKSLAVGAVKEEKPFLPLLPGFIPENAENCSQCITSACKTKCPEEIVMIGENRLPYLDFSRRGCTFCGECALACEHDLFLTEPVEKIDALVRIGILSCLAWNKTICRSCADVCNDRAIEFTGMFNPEINPDKCTACGFCIGVCPAYTITVHPKGKV